MFSIWLLLLQPAAVVLKDPVSICILCLRIYFVIWEIMFSFLWLFLIFQKFNQCALSAQDILKTSFILHLPVKNLNDTVLVSVYSLQKVSINSARDGHF